jgi:hypothetical protein
VVYPGTVLSAADRDWVTDDSDAVPFTGGVRELELRELPAPPSLVLATIVALAPELALMGHAATAAERGRWGSWRNRPFTSYVVRVAPARPGTAISLRILAKEDEPPPLTQRMSWRGWAATVAGLGITAAMDPFVGFAMATTVGWMHTEDRRAMIYRRERLLRFGEPIWVSDAQLAAETEAWRTRFWRELEHDLARRLTHRSTYREPEP